MFLARMVFFQLHESPRYLVHAGRPHDAIKSLQMISKFNGSDLAIELEDVCDHHPPETERVESRARANSRTIFDAVVDGSPNGSPNKGPIKTVYSSTESSPVPEGQSEETEGQSESPTLRRNDEATTSVPFETLCWKLPRWLRKPLLAWWNRFMMVLSPVWLRITLLVWAAWCLMSLGGYFATFVFVLD